MAPVERVHEEAVGEHATPCAEQRRRADAVRVATENRVLSGPAECAEHQDQQGDETGDALFGESARVEAVRRDVRAGLVLPGTDADRVADGPLEAFVLPREPAAVV